MTIETQEIGFSALLGSFQHMMNLAIEDHLAKRADATALTAACAHALQGGKRFRPALVFLVAEALGHDLNVTSAALAIEFFHTASLVADDLPCMDNDDERRGQPSVHKTYSEAEALLVTYALIAEGYHCLTQSDGPVAPEARLLAIENVAWNTSFHGASGGQFLDLFPPDVSIETLHSVICKKTVSLFEIAFVLGWIYGGGTITQLEAVKGVARHYGMAFQIADDFDDVQQDVEHECQVNLVIALGKEAALTQFEQEINGYRNLLKQLGIATASLLALADALEHKVG